MSKGIGDEAERGAFRYLIKQGLKPVINNYRCRWGEIDIIMRDGEYLVFIEVRARQSMAFGGALASVTKAKRQKLIRTAQHYQWSQNIYGKSPARFDLVVLQGFPGKPEWIKNAFDLDY
ncbi:YraN family protein [Legionella spiritensis]|uniref:UPF0102 protein Lspi_0130 n=1 Tax=Legionella spiritensis TaxID=452 RepID=A0A0W0ZBD1_LEGSP|nr:YraN family protein [Legionella spiritensis]KTD66367.1 hypothetical protein Lspi_0130 [Legionella spiritensis]SNV48879.1 putative endonuclease distantly related to archaeal Holliday junction resolvase [Legionella spiritensis]